jgi:hypothetical protein
MVSNYKVGQITPFIYAGIAGCWYWYRHDSEILAGAALTVAALTKPYFIAPAAVLISRERFKGIGGLIGGVGAGYAIGIVAFGVDKLNRYMRILIEFAVGSETSGVGRITEWSVESVNPFFPLVQSRRLDDCSQPEDLHCCGYSISATGARPGVVPECLLAHSSWYYLSSKARVTWILRPA